MTADLVARLAQEIRRVDGSHSLGAGALAEALAPFIEREAASALRSSGEAVAWPDRMVNMPCPDGSTDRILGFRIPEGDPILGEFGLSEPLAWLRSVTVDRCPATPASAWRPIAEAPRDGTQILGYWPDRGCHAVAFCSDGWWRRAQDEGALTPPVLWQSITPPTSTKGG